MTFVLKNVLAARDNFCSLTIHTEASLKALTTYWIAEVIAPLSLRCF